MNKILFKIARNNISRRENIVVIVFLCVLVCSLLFVLVWGTLDTLKSGLKLNQERHGADVVVYPLESDLDGSSLLYTGVAQSVYMPKEIVNDLTNEMVSSMTTQYFLQTLPGGGCCSVELEMRLVGIDWDTDFMVKPWLMDHSVDGLDVGQIIVGSNVDADRMIMMTILNYPMKIVGHMEPTGSFLDESIICNIDHLRDLAVKNFNSSIDPSEAITCAMIRIKEDADVNKYLESIRGINANIVSVSDLQLKHQHEINMFSTILTLLMAVIVVLCVIAIATQFYMMIQMRIKEVGYLRSIGMKRSVLFRMFMIEFGLVGLPAGLVGSLLGMILIMPVVNRIRNSIVLPVASIDFKFMLIHLLIGLALTIVICTLSTLIPLVLTNRLSPHEMITKGEL